MSQNKDINPEIKSDSDQKDNQKDISNNQTPETESAERDKKEEDLRTTNKLLKNTHLKPADEQQFEENKQNQCITG